MHMPRASSSSVPRRAIAIAMMLTIVGIGACMYWIPTNTPSAFSEGTAAVQHLPAVAASPSFVVGSNGSTIGNTSDPPVSAALPIDDVALRMFDAHPHTDVNAGAAFDLLHLSRRRCHPAPDTPSHASEAVVCHDETLHTFVARCAAACHAIGGGLECTAFVVLYDGECILKRFLLTHRLPRQEARSYIRRLSTASKPFVDHVYRSSPPAEFRRTLGFGVLATASLIPSRLTPALSTWLCQTDALFLFEDDASSRRTVESFFHLGHHGGGTERPSFWRTRPTAASDESQPTDRHVPSMCMRGKQVSFAVEPSDPSVRSYNGAWKNFPLLTELRRRMPLKHWYLIVDDDSFVVLHNLNIVVHSIYNRMHNPLARAVMFGAIFRVGGTQRELFVQGGAGILLSRAATNLLAKAVQPPPPPHGENATMPLPHDAPAATTMTEEASSAWQLPACYEYCRQWAGDIRIGCCAKMLGIAMKHDFTFWSEDIVASLGKAQRASISYFPTTLHQMKRPSLVEDTHKAVEWSLANGANPVAAGDRRVDGAQMTVQSPRYFTACRAFMPAAAGGVAAHNNNNNSAAVHCGEFRRVPVYWDTVAWYLRHVANHSIEIAEGFGGGRG